MMTIMRRIGLFFVFLSVFSFSCRAATLGEEDVWQTIKTDGFHLLVNRVADNVVLFGERRFSLSSLSMRMEGKSITPYSAGNWDKIEGDVQDAEKGTRITTRGTIAGVEILEERILLSDGSILMRGSGRVVMPVGRIEFVRFLGQINLGKDSFPFRAVDEEGKVYSGDIYQKFSDIESLKTLELFSGNKILQIEFREATMAKLSWCSRAGNPGFPAAYLYIFPDGIAPMTTPNIGEKFTYTVKIKMVPQETQN